VPPDLPNAPGVYQFEDAAGTPIYVGKSVNLRRRVRGYFYGGGPTDAGKAEMLRLARGVTVRRTGSDLEARLEEAERIVRFRPPYNRVYKNRARGWYVEIDWGAPFPRLRVVRAARRRRARYLGPYRGRRLPEEAVKLAERIFRLRTCAGAIRPGERTSPCLQHGIGLCTAPCVGRVRLGAYREQVRRAAILLAEGDARGTLRRAFAAARRRAIEDRRAGDAIDWTRRLEWLEEFQELRHGLSPRPIEGSWLILLPGALPGGGVLLPVACGRVLSRRTVRWDDPGWVAAAVDTAYEVRLAALRAEAVFPAAALTPALIVARWLADGAPGGAALDLDSLETGTLLARLRSVQAAGRRAGVTPPRLPAARGARSG